MSDIKKALAVWRKRMIEAGLIRYKPRPYIRRER